MYFGTQLRGRIVYFVQDSGVDFDSAGAKIFPSFERPRSASESPGAGVGRATVRRIIERQRGEIRAETIVGKGAACLFTVGPPPPLKEPASAAAAEAEIGAPPGVKE